MQGDDDILMCALQFRTRLQAEAAAAAAAAAECSCAGGGRSEAAEHGRKEMARTREAEARAGELVLVTEDVNLQLLATIGAHGEPLRALSMRQLRRELEEREAVWWRAYCRDVGDSAIAAAGCARATFL